MAAEHYEKFKGGRYPNGIEGEEIHRYARIRKIMDVYDALTTKRSHKKSLSAFDTLIIIKKWAMILILSYSIALLALRVATFSPLFLSC